MIKLLFLSSLWLISLTGTAQTGKVILNIQGIQAAKGGGISAGIFTEKNFPKVNKQLLGTEKPVSGNRMQLTFENVPAGDYGIVAFQDIDRDKNLKTNFIGFPIEPIGFSNDAKIKLGPPAFDEAKIRVASSQTLIVTITLH